MINIANKKNCCGCSACVQHCPQQCISMLEDNTGFLYPHIDESKCIGCGLCENVCPALVNSETSKPLHTYVAKHQNEAVRSQSSSGGVFYALAEMIINEGGVVFGARFNNDWRVVHSYTTTIDGLAAFRGSKYVQSEMGTCYQDAEQFLKEGREVLFTGTPCQIKGLHAFLNKNYENLYTVAIACHSVPSPTVWKDYLKGLRLKDIREIDFRNKKISWERYGLSIGYGNNKSFFEEHDNNIFMQLFLHGLTVRPSCFQCPAKNWNSLADIIIGDCWGLTQVAPSFNNDHLGVSFIVSQTNRGENFLKSTHIETEHVTVLEIEKYNGGLSKVAKQPDEYELFWQTYNKADDKLNVMGSFSKPFMTSLGSRLKLLVHGLINK